MTAPTLLELAGKMAQAARNITGGTCFTMGNTIQPIGLEGLWPAVLQLENAVDEYDKARIKGMNDSLQSADNAARDLSIKHP